jgi:adenylylsulfate kinase
MIIQLCGMSGSGKTTIARKTSAFLKEDGLVAEMIDGDEYRKELCADLGFSRSDRRQNILRLAFVAGKLSKHNVICIICAINPYEDVRNEVKVRYECVKTVFISCDINTLIKRDTKGLYKRALLPDNDPDKIKNLTGVNDPFEIPLTADLIIDTNNETEEASANKLYRYIRNNL